MRSSYIENDFGSLITKFVLAFRPVTLVELGVLDGYSTIHIAEGIRLLDSSSKLDAYDLFDDYQFKHGNMDKVEDCLMKEGLISYVNLIKGDAYECFYRYSDNSVDFLHVDISNTGDVVKDIIALWHHKISQNGIILLEGGSDERDKIDWMRKFKKSPIKRELETNEIINKYYSWATYQKFPSMTVLLRNSIDTPDGVGYGRGC